MSARIEGSGFGDRIGASGARTGRAPQGEPFAAAMSALAACADEASAAGHPLAATYVAGAAGNLRHALACLGHGTTPSQAFDMARIGASEMIGEGGLVDTITGCRLPDGSRGTVRALVPAPDPAEAVWIRRDPALAGLAVRGRVETDEEGLAFRDGVIARPDRSGRSSPDLGRDLVRGDLPDLHGCRASAAAWEMTLAGGSWVHLATGRRWYADRPTAKSLVRMLGGDPVTDDMSARRLGVAVDRDVLLRIEALGWRHWPTPSVTD